jgi:hypothetical protein
LAAARQFAPAEILRVLFPFVGSAQADGQTDHVLWMPRRLLATGKRALGNLRPDAPLRPVRANLRRTLGLGEPK